MTEQIRPGESMAMALVRSRASAIYGSPARYAARLGINTSTVNRWFKGTNNPITTFLHGAREKIAEESGRTVDEIKMLGSISVDRGCDLVLERLQEISPDAEDVHRRFLALIREKGASIPSAADDMFVTGDPACRSSLVNVLEKHGDSIPPTIEPEMLQLVLNVSGSPGVR